MEFSLICPQDGRVEVGLEDIVSVVFQDAESCEIHFACPRCGDTLRTLVKVPNVLMAALELARLAESGELDDVDEVTYVGHDVDETPGERAERERIQDSYCEYFRRQLNRVECVDDLLAEIGEGYRQPPR